MNRSKRSKGEKGGRKHSKQRNEHRSGSPSGRVTTQGNSGVGKGDVDPVARGEGARAHADTSLEVRWGLEYTAAQSLIKNFRPNPKIRKGFKWIKFAT